MKKLVWLWFGAAAAIIGLADMGTVSGAAAQTTNERLRTLENKTGDFTIKRVRRTRTLTNVFGRRTAGTEATAAALDENMVALTAVPFETAPTVATFWLDLSLTYTSSRPVQFALTPSLMINGNLNSPLCSAHFDLPASTAESTVQLEGVCQGLVHRPPDKLVQVLLVGPYEGDFRIPSLTLDVRVVNEVLLKPDF